MSTGECFWSSLHYAVNELQLTINLKPAQCKALWELFRGRDVLTVLPTGYGKSLIYQLFVFMFGYKLALKTPKILVVTPLNSIVQDQAGKLSRIGVRVGMLRNNMKVDSCHQPNTEFEDEEQDSKIHTRQDVLVGGCSHYEVLNANIIFAHPEAVFSSRAFLLSDAIQKDMVGIVIDEAHCIVDWGIEFRPDFAKLAVLASLFPHCPKLAMTATAPEDYKKAIIASLCLRMPVVISRNPDRTNIKYIVKTRLASTHGIQSYYNILHPLALELLEKRIYYPTTIIYMKLKYCGYAFRLFEKVLGVHQYYPENCVNPEHRLFGQFHAPQTEEMKESLLKQLASLDNTCRVVFATCAVGMGVDAPSIRQVIHIGVPYTMEGYFQETGRAGRDGCPSTAILYFNKSDIATNKPGFHDAMRKFCEGRECRRATILKHFGYKTCASVIPHLCCDICKENCQCLECEVELCLSLYQYDSDCDVEQS